MDKSIVFIGPFPQPFSGTTVKNSILLDSINSLDDCPRVSIIDTTHHVFNVFYHLLKTLFSNNRNILISVSAGGRRVVLPYAFFSKIIFQKNIILLPCGGTLPEELKAMSRLQLKFYTAFYNSLDQIFVETKTMKLRLNEIIPSAKIDVMFNFKPRPTKAPIKANNKGVKLVYLSRLRRDKGIFILLDALKSLRQKKIVDLTLDFYGDFQTNDTKDQSLFQEIINGLDYIQWHGYLDSKEINEILQAYDIFVFPTNCSTEGFPGALIDSAYAGLPVVLTDIAFNREIIEEGKTGLFCKANDVDSLAESIQELYYKSDARKKMGELNWSRSIDFDSHASAKRIINTFK